MRIDYKREVKIWSIYFAAILISVYIHELGHCIPAWIKGFKAIPTPAKEYILGDIPENVQKLVSLCGIIGTILFSLTVLAIYWFKDFKYQSAWLAGSIAVPGVYILRFILSGRGHDGTEFQEAQAALGFRYSGHALDWIFLGLFMSGIAIWIIKSNPSIKVAGRLMLGVILTFIFIVGLQAGNNAIFDPIFLE
jgi:hypothetical protein